MTSCRVGLVLGGRHLRPAEQAVIFGFVVIHADLDADESVGNEKDRILRIEGDPAQIGEPDLDPGVAALAHLEGQHPVLHGNIKGPVEGHAVDDPDRNPDGAQQGGAQVGIVLAVPLARLEGIEGVVLFGRRHVMDVIDHPGDDPLHGVKFGFDPLCELGRQLSNPGIVHLHLLASPSDNPP